MLLKADLGVPCCKLRPVARANSCRVFYSTSYVQSSAQGRLDALLVAIIHVNVDSIIQYVVLFRRVFVFGVISVVSRTRDITCKLLSREFFIEVA